MRIYRSVTFDIETGEKIAEDSFEYDGPIAECKGDVETETVQSPEAREALQAIMPALYRIGLAGQFGGVIPEGQFYGSAPQTSTGDYWADNSDKGYWSERDDEGKTYWIPSGGGDITGTATGTAGVTGADTRMPAPPGTLYSVPQAPINQLMNYYAGAMPSAANIGAISPEIKQAVAAPYLEAIGQVTEQFGGGMGSAMGGVSGAGAKVLQDSMTTMIPQYTQQLWNMVQPATLASATAASQAAMQEWGAETTARAAPYSAISDVAGGTMPTTVGGMTKK